MKINRNQALKIHYVLDNILPPFIRDSFLMRLPFKWLYGEKYKVFFSFKQKAPFMSEKVFQKTYQEVEPVLMERLTDVSDECMKQILRKTLGKKVLDIGCGKCVLSSKLNEYGFQVTAADIIIDKDIKEKYPQLKFEKANIEKMPFANNSFDTVICTHTLEHIQDLYSAIKELRRVAKKRLIIVVPKQRPYKYTFDLHLHFFPYKHSLQALMRNKNHTCKIIDGDIFYYEDFK